jgi:hypothetical protein
MVRRRTQLLIVALTGGLLSGAFVFGSDLEAQPSPHPWALRLGGGLAGNLGGSTSPNDHGGGGTLFAHLTHTVTDSWQIGGEVTGAWVDGEYVTLSRHMGSFIAIRSLPIRSVYFKAGAGLTWVTVETVDRPDPGGPPGDALVSIGDEMGVGLLAGVGLDVGFRSQMALTLGLDLQVQSVPGGSNGIALLSAGLKVR